MTDGSDAEWKTVVNGKGVKSLPRSGAPSGSPLRKPENDGSRDGPPLPKLWVRRRLAQGDYSVVGLTDRQDDELMVIKSMFEGAVKEVSVRGGNRSDSPSSSSDSASSSADAEGGVSGNHRASTPVRRYRVSLTARSGASTSGREVGTGNPGPTAELEVCYGRMYPVETPMLELRNIDWLPKSAQDELHRRVWKTVVDHAGHECIFEVCNAISELLRQYYDPTVELSLAEQMRRRQEHEVKRREAEERERNELAERKAAEDWERQMRAERERLVRYDEKRRAAERVGEAGRGGNLDFLPEDDQEAPKPQVAGAEAGGLEKNGALANAGGAAPEAAQAPVGAPGQKPPSPVIGAVKDKGRGNPSPPKNVMASPQQRAQGKAPPRKTGSPQQDKVSPKMPEKLRLPSPQGKRKKGVPDESLSPYPQRRGRQDVSDDMWSARFHEDRSPSRGSESDDYDSLEMRLYDNGSSCGFVFQDSGHVVFENSVAPPVQEDNAQHQEPAPLPVTKRGVAAKAKPGSSPKPKPAPSPPLQPKSKAANKQQAKAPAKAAGVAAKAVADSASQPRGVAGTGGRYAVDFEELKFLGRGGFGAVTKVRHRVDQQIYAIKRIALVGSESSRDRLIQECALLPRLTHVHIVRYYQAWIEMEMAPAPVATGGGKVAAKRKSVQLESTQGGVQARDDWLSHAGTTPRALTKDLCQMQGPTREYLYIQMEYCDGTNLRDVIDSGELIKDEALIWKLFRQILDALAYVHSKGLIHRDLKPANVFLSRAEEGQAKLGDFGLTTEVASPSNSPSNSPESGRPVDIPSAEKKDKRLSLAVGTPLYIAPEVRHGANWQGGARDAQQPYLYDQKADMFSLGVMFFEMWHPPFPTSMGRYRTLEHFSEGLTENQRGKLTELLPQGTPKEVIQILSLLLARAPNDRIAADELLHESGLLPPGAFDPQVERVLKALENPSSTESVALIQALFGRSEEVARDVSFFEQLFRTVAELPDAEAEARDSALQLLRDICRRHGAVYDMCPLLSPSHADSPSAVVPLTAGTCGIASLRSSVVPPAPKPPRGCQLIDAGNTLLELRTNLTEPFARAAAASRASGGADDDDDLGSPASSTARRGRLRRYHTGTVYREAPPAAHGTSDMPASTQFGHPREVSSAVAQFLWWPTTQGGTSGSGFQQSSSSASAGRLRKATELATAQAQEVEFMHMLAEFMSAAGFGNGRAELRLTDSRLVPLLLESALQRPQLRAEARNSHESGPVHGEGRFEKLRVRLLEALKSFATVGAKDSDPSVHASPVGERRREDATTSNVGGPAFERAAAELASLLGNFNGSSAGGENPRSTIGLLVELDELYVAGANANCSDHANITVEQLREVLSGLQFIVRSVEGLIDVTLDALQPMDVDTYGPGLIFRISLRDGGGTSSVVCAGGRIDHLLGRFARLHREQAHGGVGGGDSEPESLQLPRGITAEIAMDKIAASLVHAAQTSASAGLANVWSVPGSSGKKSRSSAATSGQAPAGAMSCATASPWWRQPSSCWSYVMLGVGLDDSVAAGGRNAPEDSDALLDGELMKVASGLWRLGVLCEVCPRSFGPLDHRAVVESYQHQVASGEPTWERGLPDFVLTLRSSQGTSSPQMEAADKAKKAKATVRYNVRALSEFGSELMERATKEMGVRELDERQKVFEFFEKLARRHGFKQPGLALPQTSADSG